MSANTAVLIDDCWAGLEEQSDLDWDLHAISNRREAIAFLQRFENRLCVYSPYIEKLYSNYSFVVPQSDHGSITILPDEQAWHDTFQDIPAHAVEPTGVYIIPGETMGHSGLYLKIPNENRLVASKELPFYDGLRLLIRHYKTLGEAFLPVLVKGDLREYEARMPSLHLHRVKLNCLTHCSQLSVNTLARAITAHVMALFEQYGQRATDVAMRNSCH
ncbi:hypothetical protein [Pseudomonas sp. M30-35]|uniref:hypothetical protein n=1 Tax=Pseudomonas sp. M30-35 TaxID=1981174 RepID=UPI000B3BE064|nr:hypothetical protein [Pseudomonas sp. M30-35]ARU87448.1 hypothetical protein B9K09_05445 [Pseudomonas sp. M30-35]